jgi:nitroreductase
MAGGATADSGALDASEGRSSVRGYLDRPVPRQLVERILSAAARAPSGNNSQPWRVHVLTGSARARLGDVILATRQANHDQADPAPEYDYYPQDWPEPYRARRRTNGLGLHGLLGIQKGDKAIHGVRIDDPADVETKLAEALAHPGPVLIDAVVNRMELAMPPKVTAEMAKGFTLYMLKAVMGGRGDEVVELARSNLLR